MVKTTLIILTIILIALVASIFIIGPKINSNSSISAENSEIKDSVQYITIKAGGGYSPKLSSVKANMPTKLIVKTNGAYDCSSSLIIHSIGFQKILPQTGETEIDLGTQKAGESLQGVCSMGMYSFLINFN